MRKSRWDKSLEDLDTGKIKTLKKQRNICHLFEGQKEAVQLQKSEWKRTDWKARVGSSRVLEAAMRGFLTKTYRESPRPFFEEDNKNRTFWYSFSLKLQVFHDIYDKEHPKHSLALLNLSGAKTHVTILKILNYPILIEHWGICILFRVVNAHRKRIWAEKLQFKNFLS